jgi:hypothetical protein
MSKTGDQSKELGSNAKEIQEHFDKNLKTINKGEIYGFMDTQERFKETLNCFKNELLNPTLIMCRVAIDTVLLEAIYHTRNYDSENKLYGLRFRTDTRRVEGDNWGTLDAMKRRGIEYGLFNEQEFEYIKQVRERGNHAAHLFQRERDALDTDEGTVIDSILVKVDTSKFDEKAKKKWEQDQKRAEENSRKYEVEHQKFILDTVLRTEKIIHFIIYKFFDSKETIYDFGEDNRTELTFAVGKAIRSLLARNHSILRDTSNYDAIASKLAPYLKENLSSKYDLEIEIKDNSEQPTMLIRDTKKLINIMALEIRKSTSKEKEIGMARKQLKRFTVSPLNYRLGLLIVFRMGQNHRRLPYREGYKSGNKLF